MQPNKLMVVAHPDDEVLFGGAQLILSDRWKVVCVTNGDNPIRRSEFESVMRVTNSVFEIWSYYDSQYTPLDEESLKPRLKQLVVGQNWHKVVTHNLMGEYGHLHHIQVHCLLKAITPIWSFNFDSSQYLPETVWCKKLELISMYKSQHLVCGDHISYVRNERLTQETIKLL